MFVGVKMLVAHRYPVPILVSLGVICGILAVAILASLRGERGSPQANSPG